MVKEVFDLQESAEKLNIWDLQASSLVSVAQTRAHVLGPKCFTAAQEKLKPLEQASYHNVSK